MPQPSSVARPSCKVDDILGGKYRLVRLLGEGGMAIVFEAVHLRTSRRVAIKMLNAEANASAVLVERFAREARAVEQLRSAHVGRILDVDATEAGVPYLVMEFLKGHDLAVELESRGRLDVAETTRYLLQACEAMAEAHAAGIVHRDLKPANLFLSEEGDERVVRVLDFGISKVLHEAVITQTHTIMGTPLYMSPEQLRSTKDVDARTDIWALGVIAYELVAGQPPFGTTMAACAAAIATTDPPPLRTLRPEVPEGFERVVMKALAKTPEGRYPTIQAFAEALRPFGYGDFPSRSKIATAILPLPTRAPSRREVFDAVTVAGAVLGSSSLPARALRRQKMRHQFTVMLIAAACLVGVGVAGWIGRNSSRARVAFSPPSSALRTFPSALANATETTSPIDASAEVPAHTAVTDSDRDPKTQRSDRPASAHSGHLRKEAKQASVAKQAPPAATASPANLLSPGR